MADEQTRVVGLKMEPLETGKCNDVSQKIFGKQVKY
jgi:hypothetical protein